MKLWLRVIAIVLAACVFSCAMVGLLATADHLAQAASMNGRAIGNVMQMSPEPTSDDGAAFVCLADSLGLVE